MKSKLIILSLLFASSTSPAAVCLMPNAEQLPFNTGFAVSQTVANEETQDNDIANTIYAARNEWNNKTTAASRIGNWNGTVTSSDCPSVSNTFQIGAMAFTGSNCATITGTYDAEEAGNVIAFVDYYESNCVNCGTKSITLNLDHGFTLDPDTYPGFHDIQSVLAHEFGHVLGVAHQVNGTCTDTATSCSVDGDVNTMASGSAKGEKCKRTLESDDKQSANYLYIP